MSEPTPFIGSALFRGRVPVAVGPLEIELACAPSAGRGGDCFYACASPGGGLVVAIADACGHGDAGAALLDAIMASAGPVQGDARRPAAGLELADRAICDAGATPEGAFITCWLGYVDPARGLVRYTVAGHPPALLVRDGKVEVLDKASSFPLGVSPGEPRFEAEAELLPGDKLVLYTDGCGEAASADGELFGHHRLIRESVAAGDFGALRILDACRRHAAGGRMDDDATVAVVGWRRGTAP